MLVREVIRAKAESIRLEPKENAAMPAAQDFPVWTDPTDPSDTKANEVITVFLECSAWRARKASEVNQVKTKSPAKESKETREIKVYLVNCPSLGSNPSPVNPECLVIKDLKVIWVRLDLQDHMVHQDTTDWPASKVPKVNKVTMVHVVNRAETG